MKKIFSAVFDGIGLFLNMALFSVVTVLAFIECLQADGFWAVGYFILSLLLLGIFLSLAYYIGDRIKKEGEK